MQDTVEAVATPVRNNPPTESAEPAASAFASPDADTIPAELEEHTAKSPSQSATPVQAVKEDAGQEQPATLFAVACIYCLFCRSVFNELMLRCYKMLDSMSKKHMIFQVCLYLKYNSQLGSLTTKKWEHMQIVAQAEDANAAEATVQVIPETEDDLDDTWIKSNSSEYFVFVGSFSYGINFLKKKRYITQKTNRILVTTSYSQEDLAAALQMHLNLEPVETDPYGMLPQEDAKEQPIDCELVLFPVYHGYSKSHIYAFKRHRFTLLRVSFLVCQDNSAMSEESWATLMALDKELFGSEPEVNEQKAWEEAGKLFDSLQADASQSEK